MLITHLNWQRRINKKGVFGFFEAQGHLAIKVCSRAPLYPFSALSGMPLRPGLSTRENALNAKLKNTFIEKLRFKGFNKLLKGAKWIIFTLHPGNEYFHTLNHLYPRIFSYITRETKTFEII
jgi:hypothetical protein